MSPKDVDYTFHDDEPPEATPRAERTTLSHLEANMAKAAKSVNKWGRIATYNSDTGARAAASKLRNNQLAPLRPPGSWEFKAGPTDDGRFGVWARLIEP